MQALELCKVPIETASRDVIITSFRPIVTPDFAHVIEADRTWHDFYTF
jgi:hypothetical protein